MAIQAVAHALNEIMMHSEEIERPLTRRPITMKGCIIYIMYSMTIQSISEKAPPIPHPISPTPTSQPRSPTLSPSISSPSLRPFVTPFRYPRNAKPPISPSASSALNVDSILTRLHYHVAKILIKSGIPLDA
ncbi:hypothetical protein L3X38_002260 [Prunus dulcis]|uniref:Uncharacterized protein n=1 Tax=Prunus dulcis TaxID=3755 RepID=A0AAD4ZL14_PRUDU|nr:hypothetical protein L3X38_002260 [Prunus dulcis]